MITKDMIVTVAFYKWRGDWIDRLIRKLTSGPYSHCELIVSGKWLSVSPREGTVRYKKIVPKPDHWDFIEIPVNMHQVSLIEDFASHELFEGYDWLGILFTQFINFNRQSKNRWFCSELVAAALQSIGLLGGLAPHRLDPNELYVMVKMYEKTN